MPKTLIEQKPTFDKRVEGEDKLAIAELFCDTLQGEGISVGVPSTFLRLQGCTLKCVWCDTLDVWPYGNEYSFDELFELFEKSEPHPIHENRLVHGSSLIEKLKNGQHLILTGGSPLKQQLALVGFITKFKEKYGFKPYIEVENEAVLMPYPQFSSLVDQWNNSPKLSNSGMKERVRIKPDVIEHMAKLKNSWFKFVVQNEGDWEEIEKDYLPLIQTYSNKNFSGKNQIILMPEGQNQAELAKTREIVADIAIREGVKFTDRLHVTIWNKKTGV